MRRIKTFGFAITFALIAALAFGGNFRAADSGDLMMYLTTKDYEAGISFRDVQKHAPIGMIVNSCSYADYLVPSIDWNDGKGAHKPDTNIVTAMFQKVTPVIQNGVYLFWDDSHRAPEPGTTTVTTTLVVHCLGDPPGNQTYVANNVVHSYARVPVKQIQFEKNGKNVDTVKGHDSVDVMIALDAPAPASGTWVKLETSPPTALNSLPPFYLVRSQQTQATISSLETQEPTANTNLVVSASTVGPTRHTKTLVVTP
jgi:hypothetical protein